MTDDEPEESSLEFDRRTFNQTTASLPFMGAAGAPAKAAEFVFKANMNSSLAKKLTPAVAKILHELTDDGFYIAHANPGGGSLKDFLRDSRNASSPQNADDYFEGTLKAELTKYGASLNRYAASAAKWRKLSDQVKSAVGWIDSQMAKLQEAKKLLEK